MKLEDFPIELVALSAIDGFETTFFDLIGEDYNYKRVLVRDYFFERFARALDYLGIDTTSITGITLENCDNYREQLLSLQDKFYQMYSKRLSEFTKDNSELKNKHPNDDLLGTTFNPV